MESLNEGGNGEGAEPIDVVVQEVDTTAADDARTNLTALLITLLEKAQAIAEKDAALDTAFYQLGNLIAKLAPMAMPRLSTVHNVTEDMDKLMERMGQTFSVEDAQMALTARKKRLQRLRAKTGATRRPGRPRLIQPGENDGA